MDQEAMVIDDLELGRKAVEAFDEFGLDARGAFWLYRSEAGVWRLVVVTPLVDQKGPHEAYARIAGSLEKKNLLKKLPLSRVTAMATDDPLFQSLRKAVHTGSGIAGIRFRDNVVNGIHIDDAYIYRMQ